MIDDAEYDSMSFLFSKDLLSSYLKHAHDR